MKGKTHREKKRHSDSIQPKLKLKGEKKTHYKISHFSSLIVKLKKKKNMKWDIREKTELEGKETFPALVHKF